MEFLYRFLTDNQRNWEPNAGIRSTEEENSYHDLLVLPNAVEKRYFPLNTEHNREFLVYQMVATVNQNYIDIYVHPCHPESKLHGK
ncbi:hypothetical protein HanRHA438_Chr10g0437151 [Helianthus annuus]|nr:hypothetical protein HanRHA438_Chr10g0437151 [Helianthus annuus]